jgi:histidyl-tRNA synthetase
LLLEESKIVRREAPDAYVAHHGAAAAQFAFSAAELLRDRGLAVTLDCSGAGFKSQMKKADASGARYAVIVGADEVAAHEVSIKPLRELAEQTRCSVAEVADLIKTKRG